MKLEILRKILKVLTDREVIIRLIDLLEEIAKETKNPIDDEVLRILRALIEE